MNVSAPDLLPWVAFPRAGLAMFAVGLLLRVAATATHHAFGGGHDHRETVSVQRTDVVPVAGPVPEEGR